MSDRHLTASIADPGDGEPLALLIVDEHDDVVDPSAGVEGMTGTVEVTPLALAQLVDAVSAGRRALTELAELCDQLDLIGGAMEVEGPKAYGGRRRRAILNKASAYRQAADLARVRLRRVDYR